MKEGIKMKVEVVKKTENPLFKRTEVEFRVEHPSAPTPRRFEVRAQLASLLGTSEELLVIEKFAGTHGRQMASGIARVYSTREQLEAMEPKYLLKRGMPEEKKLAEVKPETKVPEGKGEKPAQEKTGK